MRCPRFARHDEAECFATASKETLTSRLAPLLRVTSRDSPLSSGFIAPRHCERNGVKRGNLVMVGVSRSYAARFYGGASSVIQDADWRNTENYKSGVEEAAAGAVGPLLELGGGEFDGVDALVGGYDFVEFLSVGFH